MIGGSDGQADTLIQARGIKSFATRAADEAERRYARKPAGGKPLVILAGEDHSIPAHYLAQMEILRQLKERGYTVAAGMEQPASFTKSLFNHEAQTIPGLSKKDIAARAGFLADQVPHGDKFHLAALMAAPDKAHCPYANRLRARFIMRDHIPVALNDSSIDPHDDTTRGSPASVSLRNAILMENAQNHIAAVKPDIYVQLCGTVHVAGHDGDTADTFHSYADSLAARYQGHGWTVLALPVGFGPLFPRLCDEALTSGALLKNCIIKATLFDKAGENDHSWIQNAAPQLWPGTDLHENLDGFKLHCRTLTDYVFSSVAARAGQEKTPALIRQP